MFDEDEWIENTIEDQPFQFRPSFKANIPLEAIKMVLPVPASMMIVIDGRLESFEASTPEGGPVSGLLNDIVIGYAASYFRALREEPVIPTQVTFSHLDFTDHEAFYSDDGLLEAALWSADLRSNQPVIISTAALGMYVPQYNLIGEALFVRLRDCIDLLEYARFAPELLHKLSH